MMLARAFERHGTTVEAVVDRALRFLCRCQLPDGSVTDDPGELILQYWDSVHAVRAIALWRDAMAVDCSATVDGLLAFLRSRENSDGMISWGTRDIASSEYSTETSAEYIMALARLGRLDEARARADYLRSRQSAAGPWEEVHSHIPKVFQTSPSVTALALMALQAVDLTPNHLREALDSWTGPRTPQGTSESTGTTTTATTTCCARSRPRWSALPTAARRQPAGISFWPINAPTAAGPPTWLGSPAA